MTQFWMRKIMKYNRRHVPRRQNSSTDVIQTLEHHQKKLWSKQSVVLGFCLLFAVLYVFYREDYIDAKDMADLETEDIIFNKSGRDSFVSEELKALNPKAFNIVVYKRPNDEEAMLLKSQEIPTVITNLTTLPECVDTFIGNVSVDKNIDVNAIDLENIYPMVEYGGHYTPKDCRSKYKVAIMVPFRDREDHLRVFLYNIHPFLMRQNIEYKIFVFEQSGNRLFNRGRLFNAGFLEIDMLRGWQCVVFHDVDLLPTDNRIRYSCPSLPRHMCAAVIEENSYASGNKTRFSGVTAMTMWQYKAVNGYSNLYWGGGGEDDDMLKRIQASGVGMTTYNAEIARYTSLPHRKSPEYKEFIKRRVALLKSALQRYKSKKDGLTTIRYTKLSHASHHLYTRITIDVSPPEEIGKKKHV